MGLIALKIAVAVRAGALEWGRSRGTALRSAALLAPAGEFAFVLVPMAGALAILDAQAASLASALAALTMVLGPITAKAIGSGLNAATPPAGAGIRPRELRRRAGHVLVIGFGRFGQPPRRCCPPTASTSP